MAATAYSEFSVLSLLQHEDELDEEMREEAHAFAEWLKLLLLDNDIDEQKVGNSLKRVLEFRIKAIQWLQKHDIEYGDLKDILDIMDLGNDPLFGVVAEPAGDSISLMKATFEHLQKAVDLGQLESLADVGEISIEQLGASISILPPAVQQIVKNYLGSSLMIEFCLIGIFMMKDDMVKKDAALLKKFSEWLNKYNQLYLVSCKASQLLPADYQIASKSETVSHLQQILINGPVMSDEEYEYFLEKRAHFNKWN